MAERLLKYFDGCQHYVPRYSMNALDASQIDIPLIRMTANTWSSVLLGFVM